MYVGGWRRAGWSYMGSGLQMGGGCVVWIRAGLSGVGLVGWCWWRWWWCWWWCEETEWGGVEGEEGEPGFERRPVQSLWLIQLLLLLLLLLLVSLLLWLLWWWWLLMLLHVLTEFVNVLWMLFLLLVLLLLLLLLLLSCFFPRMSSIEKEVWPLPVPEVWALFPQLMLVFVGLFEAKILRAPLDIKFAALVARTGLKAWKCIFPCAWKSTKDSMFSEQWAFGIMAIV